MIIDAKLIPVWQRHVFDDLHAHGVAAVSVVCSIWEDLSESIKKFAELKRFVADNDDLLYQVVSADQIRDEFTRGRTGVIFSWQNSTGFGGDVDDVEMLARMGLRIAQPTFIAGNAAGSGCYDDVDKGLTDFGHELVAALNQSGVAIDLSHVGEQTARDVVKASRAPVFYAQSSPRTLNDSRRNKSDADMRRIADDGGVICMTTLRRYLPAGLDSTVEHMADAVVHVVDIVGVDGVGIGSDLTPGQGPEFLEFVSRAGGDGQKLMDYSAQPVTPGFSDFSGYANLRKALRERGVKDVALEKIFFRNLERYFGEIWSSATDNEHEDRDAS